MSLLEVVFEKSDTAAFDPVTDLANQLLILNNDPTTMFESNAGTGAVIDTDPVGFWTDQSSNSYDLTSAADDATRPVYSETDYQHVYFNLDFLRNTSGALGINQGPMTFAMAVRANPGTFDTLASEYSTVDTETAYDILISLATAANASIFIREDDATVIENLEMTATNAFDGTDNVVMVTDDGSGNLEMFIDGTSAATGTYTPGTITANAFGVGKYGGDSTGDFPDCRVAGIIAVGHVSDATEKANITTWLGDLQGRAI